MVQSANTKYDRAIRNIIAAVPVFVYFLVFVGYAYSEAYLRSLGLPLSFINYSFLDYAFFGAHVDNLIITLALTAIFYGLIWYLTQQPSFGLPYKKSVLIFSISFLIYYAGVLSILTAITVFNPYVLTSPSPSTIAVVLAVLCSCMIAVGIMIMLLFFERGLIQRIKRGKNLSFIFIVASAITLICFPYMCASAWGACKAHICPYRDLYLSSNTLIKISAHYPLISEIGWETSDNNSYVNSDNLSLILKNGEYLFIKTNLKDSETYVISQQDLISYQLVPTSP